jgi:hypothetical protein
MGPFLPSLRGGPVLLVSVAVVVAVLFLLGGLLHDRGLGGV